ncbi:MAG: hypothetical protein QG588_2387 [Candidatus Poribacteria bacterium]|nr:hypothetical protein [Candidatus Poribacteria bacterium]
MKEDGSETLKLISEIVDKVAILRQRLQPIINSHPTVEGIKDTASFSPLRDGLLNIIDGLSMLINDIEL